MARIAGVDLPRRKALRFALRYIYGIGDKTSQAICDKAQVPETRIVDELTEADVKALREVIELEFSTVHAPLDVVVAWLVEHVHVRPGFHEFAREHDPLILSSSFVQTIEPLLAREGLALRVLANDVESTAGGWRVRWRDETVCAHCDEQCKRGGLPADGPVVFVGDGYSDRCAALAADRVFARDGLAAYLDRKGVPFEPFEDFTQLRAALARSSA